ncbi:MAG TPA: PQQ-dependent sugar dehydrogenase [Stellaceae bacterium]|nr:PQQ-dependent sugar dehydrogenase [Stellaceae bacterium]
MSNSRKISPTPSTPSTTRSAFKVISGGPSSLATPTRPEFADAIKHWTPVISPSGMVFYTGNTFPEWRGNLLIGSLTRQALVRLAVQGSQVVGEEIIPLGARIRDVEQGPDGAVYLLTDQQNGNVLRLRPLR